MSGNRTGGAGPRPFGALGWCRAGITSVLLLVAIAPATLAHEGLPRLTLEPARVNPGGIVVIRGEDLGADDEMRLVLVGGSTRTELTTVVSDGQGHFTVAVEISTDAPAGAYAIEAASQSGLNLTAGMSIEGAPIVEGDGAPVGQDEGLPAPSPPTGGASVPGPIAAIRPVAGTSVATIAGREATQVDLVPFVALAGAVGGLALLVWRTRRRPAAQPGSADLS